MSEEENIPNVPQVPLHEDGTPKVKFEVVLKKGRFETIEKTVFIDGVEFDWSIDYAALADALKMGPQYFITMKKDIIKHYLGSLSEFMGRRITPEELKNATETGWI